MPFLKPDYYADILTRSFIPATSAFALGIVLARPTLPDTILPWISAVSVAVIALIACRRTKPLLAALLLMGIFYVVGSAHGSRALSPPADPRHIANIAANNPALCLTGTLTTTPLLRDGKQKIIMEVDHALCPGEDILRPAWGRTLLTISDTRPAGLLPGTRYIVRTKHYPLKDFGTPGAFSYKDYLATQSIWSTGWIKNYLLIQEVQGGFSPSFSLQVRTAPELFRATIGKFMGEHLDQEHLGVYKALLIGDGSGIAPELLEDYRDIGIIHLIVISGTNLALLAYFCTIFYGFFVRRSTWLMLRVDTRKIILLLSGMTIFCYSTITGFQPPVLRALIMIMVFFLARLLDRQWCTLNNLAIAALIILVVQPLAIRTASFQLSFAATAAIILTTQRIAARCRPDRQQSIPARLAGQLLFGLAISTAASVATAPLLLYHFNQVSLLSPIATLIITPFLCFWSLPVGLLAMPFIGPLPELAAALFQFGAWGIDCANFIAGILAEFPVTAIHLPTPFPIEIAAFYLLIFGILCWGKGLPYRATAALAIMVLAGVPLYWAAQKKIIPQTTVSFLDVGQGSAAVLEFPSGETVLIDGGGASSEQFNVGESVIAPFLWKKRISRIAQIVLTHPHADHYNGLAPIIEHFQPEVLWLNGETPEDPVYRQLLEIAQANGVEIRTPMADGVLYSNGENVLECIGTRHLGEKEMSEKDTNRDVNNRSLVLRLSSGGYSFLFPGDVERQREELLIQDGADLKAQVLLAPHHGHRSSGSEKFLAAVAPDYIIVSSGRTGRTKNYGNDSGSEGIPTAPAPKIYTAQSGTVTFTMKTDGTKVSTYY